MQKQREKLQSAKRIVIKLGTNVLVNENGHPNRTRMRRLMADVAKLHAAGKQVTLVSSGAIGAGMAEMGMETRPTALSDLQMAAAIGQGRLIALYHSIFAKYHIKISQVLLTYDDLRSAKRSNNVRGTLLNLLQHQVIPIINENDAIADEEIRVGDNDVLSSLVAKLVDADVLILLTSPNGLQKPSDTSGKTERIPYLESVTQKSLDLAVGKTNKLSTGGMATKLQAAQNAVNNGTRVVIASGFQKQVLWDVLEGKDIGTLIG